MDLLTHTALVPARDAALRVALQHEGAVRAALSHTTALGVAWIAAAPACGWLCLVFSHVLAARAWPTVTALVAGLLWGAEPLGLVALTPMVVAAWWWSRSRVEAGVVGWLYHAAAARHLVLGAASFFDTSLVLGSAIVAVAALPAGLLWALMWSRTGREEHPLRACARLVAMLALTYAPPIGAWTMASPLAGLGVCFAGMGWWGLVAGMLALVLGRHRFGIALMLALAVVGLLRWNHRALESEIVRPAHTEAEAAQHQLDFAAQFRIAAASQEAAEASSYGQIVLLPESAGGLWQRPMHDRWRGTAKRLWAEGRVPVLGAVLEDGALDNVAVALPADGSERVYRQRFPMPLAMWRPWASDGFRAHWDGPGTLEVGGLRLGVLICWEGALVWPVLASVAEGADVLAAPANMLWLRGTGARQALSQSLFSWGMLFELPVALSVNE